MQGNILPAPISGCSSVAGNVEISSQKRSVGLDIVRIMAIFLVVGAHFFLISKFKTSPFVGTSMFLQGMVSTFCSINVALFMMLTGYLNLNKQVCKKYYKGGIRVLISYILISIITILFRSYSLGEHKGVVEWGMLITDFSAIPYGWYIEMWLGLFLLAPFLNILWKNIATKRNKVILIATLFILTAPSDFFNRYGMTLMPDYWEGACYPIMYYFLGAYIREYQPVVKMKYLLALALGICLVNPIVTIVTSYGHTFIQITGDTNGFFLTPLAVIVFLMLYRMEIKSSVAQRVLKKISILSLDMYLFSWLFDNTFYPMFKEQFFTSQSTFGIFFFVIVPLVLAASFAASWIKEILFKGIERLIAKLRHVDHLDIKLT